MNRKLLLPRCVQCVATTAAIAAAAVAGSAWAQGAGAVSEISAEFWLGLIFTALFGLVALQARNLTERVKSVEHEQRNGATALSLFMQTLPDKFYTKAEARELQAMRDLHTAEHRERMEAGMRDVKESIVNLTNRMDHIARPHHRREDDR